MSLCSLHFATQNPVQKHKPVYGQDRDDRSNRAPKFRGPSNVYSPVVYITRFLAVCSWVRPSDQRSLDQFPSCVDKFPVDPLIASTSFHSLDCFLNPIAPASPHTHPAVPIGSLPSCLAPLPALFWSSWRVESETGLLLVQACVLPISPLFCFSLTSCRSEIKTDFLR
jgi:hypothetical protein